jgi:transcriptional regulator with XRE-family HTH domain
MLAEGGLSQRKIAKATGVSRATISAIARGARPDYEARIRARSMEFELLGPIERCSTCGARVYMPCRLCRVRKLKAHQQRLQIIRRHNHELILRRLLSAVHQAHRPKSADVA